MRVIAQKPLEEIRAKEQQERDQKESVKHLEEEIKVLKLNPNELQKQINIGDVSLEELKAAKDAQLNHLCNQAILDGFLYTIDSDSKEYRFSYDVEAQLNFQGAIVLATAGQLTEMEWTARNAEGNIVRVVLKASDFAKLAGVMVQHKNKNISKYRDELMPQLLAAETKEQVDAVVWE